MPPFQIDNAFAQLNLRQGQSASSAPTQSGAAAAIAPHQEAKNTADAALDRLKSLPTRSTPERVAAIGLIEQIGRRRQTLEANCQLFQVSSLAGMPREDQIALGRSPSFLLMAPTLDQMGQSQTRSASGMTAPLSHDTKVLTTARVAALRSQIKFQQQQAVDLARSGRRWCPMTLKAQPFQSYLEANRAKLDQLVFACEMTQSSGSEAAHGTIAGQALEKSLNGLAQAYLTNVGKLPSGLTPGSAVEIGGVRFDASPVSTVLAPEGGRPRFYMIDDEDNTKLAIWFSNEDIEEYASSPMTTDNKAYGWTDEFKDCSMAKRKAVAYLQNLFMLLQRAEEEMELGDAPEQRAATLPGPVLRTLVDKMYEGSEAIGDECANSEEPNQRFVRSYPLRLMHSHADIYEAANGSPLLLDDKVNRWAKGDEFYSDMQTVIRPDERLQIAQMHEVGKALKATGLFEPDRRNG